MSASVKSLVAQATRDNANPPSGYQLDQLTKASLRSITECQELEASVMTRLKNNSPNVKWKSLRLVRHLCLNGHANVKKAFQRHTDELRNCSNFSGPSHPLHGDTHNERVRTAAKEAMNALFSTPATETSAETNNLRSKITGFGSSDVGGMGNVSGSRPANFQSSYNASIDNRQDSQAAYNPSPQQTSYNPSVSNRPMVGFGNSTFQKQPSPASFMDRVKKVFEPVAGKAAQAASTLRSSAPQSLQPFGLQTGYKPSFSPARGELDVKPLHATSNVARKRGQVGGVWADDAHCSAPVDSFTSNQQQPQQKPQLQPQSSQPQSSQPERIPTQSSGQLETRLIEAATATGGIKTAPTKEQISEIIDAFDSLDLGVMLELLDAKLRSNHWQAQLKSLHIIDALMTRDAEPVQEFFHARPDAIVVLVSSTTRSVRNKADLVVSELGLNSSSATPVEPTTEAAHHPTPASDLLDLSTLSRAGPSTQEQSQTDLTSLDFLTDASTAPTEAQKAKPTNNDLFSSIQLRSKSESRTAPRQDPLDFLNNPEPLPPGAAEPPSFDPLMESAATNATAPSSGSGSAFAFLREDNASLPAQPPAQLPSAFPGVLGGTFAPAAPGQQPAEPISSGFKFIDPVDNGAANAPEAEQSPPRQMDPFSEAVKPTRKNFNPRSDSFSFVQDMMKG